ncbi:winged helix-turn-helix transcriptional regulator [Halolamina salifodinae]|uniref:DNA-binding HxlR family transcriptional regulator n=1 Tax=Halolamina salifodinae TaxID=1202767 RepID=A0A8T4GSC9_9EURY|nr:helix-turn-helix domain-containing protein [Halolamina salifodinae]MBP1985779.1 DNA-binding HxlR family transcriptional regulator [Halolamina salifodinae]
MSQQPRPDAPECYCRLEGVIDLLSRKYAMQIVCVVDHLGTARYGELESAFGGDVSSSTLSARLDDLVSADLLEREQYDEIPPRVEYTLTGDGESLAERLEPLLR